MPVPHRLFEIEDNEYAIFESNKEKFINQIICDDILKITNKLNRSNIEQGHTYLGQMIAHDIVPSTNLIEDRKVIAPQLNLDSLYGDDIRPAYFDKSGKFILGYAIDENNQQKIFGKDLFRGKEDKALIPDRRNDENIIISQLHLIWQKLHNKIIDIVQVEHPHLNHFELSKNIVIKIFNEIVIHDYLNQVLHPNIFNIYFRNDSNFYFFYKNLNNFNQIPYEFSHAVFRFGHSMVRDRYDLTTDPSVPPVKAENMLSNRKLKLTKDSIINWGNFFTVDKFNLISIHSQHNSNKLHDQQIIEDEIIPTVGTASKIDTHIINALENVPFIKNTFKDIRKINLEAEFINQVMINSGETIRQNLLTHSEFEPYLKDVFYEEESLKKLSLWPYILKEAELNTNNAGFQNHGGLGVIGSIITAEVLKASINTVYYLMPTNDLQKPFECIVNQIKKNQIDKESNSLSPAELNEYTEFINGSPLKMGFIINFIE